MDLEQSELLEQNRYSIKLSPFLGTVLGNVLFLDVLVIYTYSVMKKLRLREDK